MRRILIIHNDDTRQHVRGRKFISYFSENGYDYHLYFWKRIKGDLISDKESTVLLVGGGYGTTKLFGYYLRWVSKVFFHFLFKKLSEESVLFVIDFDSALPIFLVSIFRRRIVYIYDIHDDFALRYNWGRPIKFFISKIDSLVKRTAFKVIHVDENRVRQGDSNYLIIRNTPPDFLAEARPTKKIDGKTFVASGLLSSGRGMNSIKRFAISNPQLNFIFAGKVPDNEDYSDLFSLPNCKYLGFIDQESLFNQIYGSCGIFSMYDPDLEINRRAASNKLFDALMLGIPVISNYGLMSEKFILENEVGVCVSFEYDETWEILTSEYFLQNVERIGQKGRIVFKSQFSYNENFVLKLDSLFYEISVINGEK